MSEKRICDGQPDENGVIRNHEAGDIYIESENTDGSVETLFTCKHCGEECISVFRPMVVKPTMMGVIKGKL